MRTRYAATLPAARASRGLHRLPKIFLLTKPHFVTVLLKAGADPNIADAHGDTCLHDAVRTNYKKEVLQAIIDNGADMNEQTRTTGQH